VTDALKLDVLATDGKKAGTVELDADLFGISPNVGAMHQVVVAQRAAARRGTSKVKSRSEARGGGRKPWRQKGTGRARHGSIRAPQWTGGGVAHGPSGEQNYTKRASKKLKRLALRSALSDRASASAVRVVADLRFDTPRTKDAVALLESLGLVGQRVLLVLATPDEVVGRSFRMRGPAQSIYTMAATAVMRLIERYDKRFCSGDATETTGDLAHYTPGHHFSVFSEAFVAAR
jgi:large subunit ribosomal protein L4